MAAADAAALRHRNLTVLREAFASLFAHASRQRMLRRHLAALLQRRAASAWRGWRAATTRRRAAVARAGELRSRVARRLARSQASCCFAALRQHTRRQRGAAVLLARVLLRHMELAFSAWALHTFQNAAGSELLAQRLSRTQAVAFAWWRYYATVRTQQKQSVDQLHTALLLRPRHGFIASSFCDSCPIERSCQVLLYGRLNHPPVHILTSLCTVMQAAQHRPGCLQPLAHGRTDVVRVCYLARFSRRGAPRRATTAQSGRALALRFPVVRT